MDVANHRYNPEVGCGENNCKLELGAITVFKSTSEPSSHSASAHIGAVARGRNNHDLHGRSHRPKQT